MKKPKRNEEGYSSWLSSQEPDTLNSIELKDFIAGKLSIAANLHRIASNLETEAAEATSLLKKKSLSLIKEEA